MVDAVVVAPKPPRPTTLLVASCGHHGRDIIAQMGGSQDTRVCGDYRIVWPGIGLAGFRADMILVTAEARRGRSSREREDSWWQDLSLRLSKDGKLVNL